MYFISFFFLVGVIFKMNWIIQAIVSFHKKPSLELILLLEDKVNEIINSKQKERVDKKMGRNVFIRYSVKK